MSLGIQSLGLSPSLEAEDTVYNFMGIFSKNREEWAVVAMACMRSSVTIVPFFESLGVSGLSSIINLTELQSVCIDHNSFETLLKTVATAGSLKNVILFDNPTEDQRHRAENAGLKLYSYEDILR